MSIVNSIRSQFAPIHPEGYPFIGGLALLSLILFWICTPLGWFGVVMTAWCAYFFRDPPRVSPVGANWVLSPADGLVSAVQTAVPPAEIGLGDIALTRISIFMNVFNVHSNRISVDGVVKKVQYFPGLFINADLDKASTDNERNAVILDAGGRTVTLVQVAGLIARRIL